jgi:hypothetical protein
MKKVSYYLKSNDPKLAPYGTTGFIMRTSAVKNAKDAKRYAVYLINAKGWKNCWIEEVVEITKTRKRKIIINEKLDK